MCDCVTTVTVNPNGEPALLPLEENANILSDFGLTHNEAKVYVTAAKAGLASISQISKLAKVRREDVYRMLPKLQKMGLIEKILGKPIKIRATPVEDALSILLERERDLANERLSKLIAKKGEFLKNFKAYQIKPVENEGSHFALISQREAIVNRGMNLIETSEEAIDVITSRYEFYQLFANYAPSVRKAIRKGVKVRVVLDVSEQDNAILRIIEEYKSFAATFDLKYTYQSSSHILIVDHKEALVATSPEPPIGRNPYLWTDNNNVVKLMQKYFEDAWHSSLNHEAMVTTDVSEKALHFINQMKPTNHVVFLYESPEVKHAVLFSYIREGLRNGEATIYVATEECPSRIRKAMKQFGINVEKHEKKNALRVLDCNDVYLIDGKFSLNTTISLWRRFYDDALASGFSGLRVTGEMSCFFQNDLIRELIEYEKALHRVLDIPIVAICAYNTSLLNESGDPINLYTELVRAHGMVLFTGIDQELGRIEIRKG